MIQLGKRACLRHPFVSGAYSNYNPTALVLSLVVPTCSNDTRSVSFCGFIMPSEIEIMSFTQEGNDKPHFASAVPFALCLFRDLTA